MPPPVRAKKRDDFYRDRRRRKVCAFCADKTVQIDYKEVNRLRRYLSERAKIEPRRKTGTCAGHQRELAVALKRARHVALLPYAPAAPPPLTPTLADRRRRRDRRAADARRRSGRGRVRVAAGPRRRAPDRPAADARLRAAAARGGRRLAGLRDHDQQRRGRRLPRAARGQPAPRDDPRAVHGDRGAGRWLDRVPPRRAAARAAVRRPAAVHGRHDGPRRRCGPRPPVRPVGRRRRRGAAAGEPRDDARAPVRDRATGSGTSGSAWSGATGAGVVSALLGIGGGIDQGAADAPRDGRPAAGRDRHEQHDDRDHRRRQRDHLPDPRRHRPVRRRARPRSASSSARPPGRGSPTASTCDYLRLLFVVVLVYTAFQMLAARLS